MSKPASHNMAFNLASSIRSNNRAPMLFPEEYDAWEVHMQDYITDIDKVGMDVWKAIKRMEAVSQFSKKVHRSPFRRKRVNRS